jgi:iron(III) transport system substrate-binding protein
MVLPAAGLLAQPIENDLVLVTPAAKSLTDPALAAFARHVRDKWNVSIRVSALAAGAPLAYGRIVEWKGRPEADIFWGGESMLYDRLAEQGLLVKAALPEALARAIPPAIGAPKPILLKDPRGYWTGTLLEPCGLVYHPKLFQRLGLPEPKDWDDLLDPRLKGHVAQSAPTLSSSSHATYEVILQRDGERQGWEWLRRLAGNTGIFTPRSRDVPSVVAKGEFAAGFAVPSYMAFEDRLAGFAIRFVAPPTAWTTVGPIAALAGARHPHAAQAFIAFMLGEHGQRIAMERGVFPIVPQYRLQGLPGSTVELAVEFSGGMRSYFDRELMSIYDAGAAQARYERVNARFRSDIETVWPELKR